MMKGGIDMWLCKLLGHKPRMFEGTMTTHTGDETIGPEDFTGLFCDRCGEDLTPSAVQMHEDGLVADVAKLSTAVERLESWADARDAGARFASDNRRRLFGLPEHTRIMDQEETRRYFGLGNGMEHKHKVTYVIHDKTINPTIWVDGEKMAIVSCDYHYVTMSGEGNPGESILTATVVHHATDPTQHVVSINQQTGQVFYQ
jgi:hypothetical protein